MADATNLGVCFGHLDENGFEQGVKDLRGVVRGGSVVSARGVTLDRARFSRIVGRITEIGGRARIAVPLDFRGATVTGPVSFDGIELAERVRFAGARFPDGLTIRASRGLEHLELGEPDAARTKLGKLAVSACTESGERLMLSDIDVAATTRIERSDFTFLRFERASLGDSLLLANLELGGLECVESAWSDGLWRDIHVIGGAALRAGYAADTKIRRSRFDSWCDLFSSGSVAAYRSVFEGSLRTRWLVAKPLAEKLTEYGMTLDAIAMPSEESTGLELDAVRVSSTAHLRWGGGPVRLPSSIFSAASTLERDETASAPPRLTSVTELEGRELRLRDVDLKHCELGRAARMGAVDPDWLPRGLGAAGLTLRSHIADEPARPRPWKLVSSTVREKRRGPASRLSATYRDLRKASEDVGDFSGGNDLHYGERLWQRKATRLGSIQWLWLAAYGLVGYGVRPWRPFAWLAAVVLASTIAYGAFGGLDRVRTVEGTKTDSIATLCSRSDTAVTLNERQTVRCEANFDERLEFSLRAATVLRPVAGFETEGIGVWIEVASRVLAALFFGLLVLAMRNRLRRD